MKMKFVCDMRWEDLAEGNSNTRRHCERCDQPVYNLSGMSRDKAARLLSLYGATPPCIRFISGKRDGRVHYADDPVSQLGAQRGGAARLLAAALVVHTAFAALGNPARDNYDPFAGLAEAVSSELDPKTEERFTTGAMAAVSSDLTF